MRRPIRASSASSARVEGTVRSQDVTSIRVAEQVIAARGALGRYKDARQTAAEVS